MASGEKRLVTPGIADVDIHRLVPVISNRLKARIEQRAQFRDQLPQRSSAMFGHGVDETVAPHYKPAAKYLVCWVDRRQCAAFMWRQQSLQHSATLRIEIACGFCPVD